MSEVRRALSYLVQALPHVGAEGERIRARARGSRTDGAVFALSLGAYAACVVTVSACSGKTLAADDAAVSIVLPGEEGGAGSGTGDGSSPANEGGGETPDASSAHDAVTPTTPIAVPLFACIPGEYSASGTVGGSQTFQFAIDTGSTTMGVAASTCSNCGVNPEYTPSTTAVDQHLTGMSVYGTGMWTGEIYQDGVTLGTSPGMSVDFVAIDTQTGFFESTTTCDSASGALQGIIGFGPSASALQGTNAFFDQLVASAGIPNVFATELCTNGGTLWLGGYDPAATTAAPQYTSMSGSFLSDYYYPVNLVSMSVNGATAAIGTPQFTDSVVDTGTSIVIVPTAAFDTLTQAIGADATFQQIFGSGTGNASSYFADTGNCVKTTQTKAELDATLPPLTMLFGAVDPITVTAVATESYLVAYEGYWCPAFTPMDPDESTYPIAALLGSPILKSNVVIFDVANQRVGFAPHAACN